MAVLPNWRRLASVHHHHHPATNTQPRQPETASTASASAYTSNQTLASSPQATTTNACIPNSGNLHLLEFDHDTTSADSTSKKNNKEEKQDKKKLSVTMARTARFAAAGCVLFAAVLLANYDPQQHMIDKSKVIGNDDDPALQHSYIRDLTALPERDYPPDEKYLLMDFSPWLGFNNMRYMLERGLYLSQMLNRTFVIPTHLRIRHCTEESVCGVTSTPLDLDAIGHNPQGSRLSLDLGYFIDLNLLARETNGRVINFRTFMEKIIKVPLGKEATLVDSRYGEQVAFWQRVMREHTDAGELDMSLISFSAPEDPDDNDDDDHDEEEQEVDGDIYNNNDRKQGDNVQHANNLNRQQQNSLFHSPRTEISLKRINRAKWDLPEDPTKSFVDNLIRNVLVDDLEFPDPTSSSSSSTNSHDNDDNDNDGPFTTRKTFYAFGDVRGGGLNQIVEWSLDFSYYYHYNNDDDRRPYQQHHGNLHHHLDKKDTNKNTLVRDKDVTFSSLHSTGNNHNNNNYYYNATPRLDGVSCTPPIQDSSSRTTITITTTTKTLKQEDIPWEARFPAFATCKIENYVGLKQVLGREDEVQVLSIEGQFHTAGWIPLAYKDRENALAYRAKAMKQLKYTPAVHEAAEYLLEKLRRQMMMDVAGGINGIGLGIGVGVGRSRDSQRPLSETSSLDEEQQVEEEGTCKSGSGQEKEQEQEQEREQSWFLLSMHVRRGDFVTDKYGWQEFDEEWMKSLVKDALKKIFPLFFPEDDTTTITTTTTTTTTTRTTNKGRMKFYLATDESLPETLAYFRGLGAVLFEDLVDDEFKERFKYLIVYEDWIGLVEQVICARARKFFGTMTSSFTSGIVNMRMSESGESAGSQGAEHAGEPLLFDNFEYLIRAGGPLYPKP